MLSEASQRVLCKLYLRKDDSYEECPLCSQKHESIDEMFDRVSFGNDEYRKILSAFDFMPNSPTMFNAGGFGTLSACFKFDVEDTMTSILEVGRKSALIQKWGGGVGYCLSELRPLGAPIKSTHGKACGPVAVMHMYHAIAEMITQGGKRSSAQMGILHCDHPDIMQFIKCKEKEGVLDTFNISVAATDEFMSHVISGENKELFDAIVRGAWSNGDPGLYFIDIAERFNPTPKLGKLTATNPCGEVPLLDNESCNLGSINLSHFITKKHSRSSFDLVRLGSVVRIVVRYLDDVIEHNFYPVEEVREATLRTRKLGLGVMGWADALAMLQIPYDSWDACNLGSDIMRLIQDVGHQASKDLWTERGPCPADPMKRNVCVTCIAPAGTISTVSNCSSGIEPHFSLEYTQFMGDGEALPRVVKFGDFVPKTADQISWYWHIRHQAAFQKFTDLAVSKTINLPNSATEEDVRNAYRMAWETGCKGITIYREGSRIKQALRKSGEVNYETDVKFRGRRKLKKDGVSLRHKFDVGDVEGYLHIGLYDDGRPGELFITGVKQGSTISGLLDGIAILTSLALQRGVPLEEMVSKLQGTRFEPAGITGNVDIPTTTSLLDYIFRYVQLHCNGGTEVSHEFSGALCPNCGAVVKFQEGCMYCSADCGWSRC